MSDAQQPDLDPTLFGNRKVVTIIWDVDEDTVMANWDGLDRFTAIGLVDEVLKVLKTEGIAYDPDLDTEEDE